MAQFCSKCSSPLPEQVKFCPHCGSAVTVVPISQPDSSPSHQSAPQAAESQSQYSYQAPSSQEQGWQQPQNQGWQQPQNQGWQQTQNQSWQQPQNQGWQQPQNQGWQQPSADGFPQERKKKSKAGLIVGLVVLFLAALGAVGCFVWPGFLKKDANEATISSANATAASSSLESSVPSEATVPTAQTEPTEISSELVVTEPVTTAPPATEPATEPVPVNPFQDVVEDDPCYEEYLWGYNHGLIVGNRLEGDTILTRGQTVMMLWRAFGCPETAQTGLPFPDLKASDNCYSAVLWAYNAKLISGTSDGTFQPDEQMTRDQAATILCSAVGGDGNGLPKAYLDVGSKKYYYNAVNWGCAAGVLERYYDFSFYPTDPLLQADFVCWLARALEPSLALDNEIPEADDLDYYGVQVNLHNHGVAYFNAAPNEDTSTKKHLKVTVESYEIFEQAEYYQPKEGYEWRKAVFLIDYGDADAGSYTYSLYGNIIDSNYVDLFEANRVENEDGTDSSWIVYNDVPYKILVAPLISERVDGALFRVTLAAQVPVGYDGIASYFLSEENLPSEYESFYDKYENPEDFVFFRFE